MSNSPKNSRWAFSLLHSKKTQRITKKAVMLLILWLITTSYWSTWPSSNSASNTIASEQYSFTGYTHTATYNSVLGSVSGSLYYLYAIYDGSNHWAIRKVNSDGSFAWMASFSFPPIIKSLSIDTSEQHVYVASNANPLDVLRLGTDTGAIVDAQRQ